MFAGLWFNSANRGKPRYIKQSGVTQVSHKLLTLRPPNDVSRAPRSLNERKYWKGSEWKSFFAVLLFDCYAWCSVSKVC